MPNCFCSVYILSKIDFVNHEIKYQVTAFYNLIYFIIYQNVDMNGN